MRCRKNSAAGFVVCLLAACGWVLGGPVRAGEGQEGKLTVAVLNFETKGTPTADLGEKVADLLTVYLSADEKLQLVERTNIKKVLEEMELGASGVVAPDQAARIGGMVGARVLITGRAFVVDEKLYITGKSISVETSLVNAQLVKGGLDEELDKIVEPLAQKMSAWLAENADKMIAHIETPQDQVEALRKALGKQQLPVVAAMVIETHIGQPAVDPAAETELVFLMRRVGITVVSCKDIRVSDWAREFLKDANTAVPKEAQKADVVIVGEAFSEYAGRHENLISVKARVEMKAVDTKTGKILMVDRATATHVDLAEHIAAKTALQKAAGQLTVQMLPKVVEEWAKLHKAEPQGK